MIGIGVPLKGIHKGYYDIGAVIIRIGFGDRQVFRPLYQALNRFTQAFFRQSYSSDTMAGSQQHPRPQKPEARTQNRLGTC